MFVERRAGDADQWLDATVGVEHQQGRRTRWLRPVRSPGRATPDHVITITHTGPVPVVTPTANLKPAVDFRRDMETFIHLLKGSLGTGILAMPMAFMNAGLLFGLVATATIGFVCTYCVHILVSYIYRTSRRRFSALLRRDRADSRSLVPRISRTSVRPVFTVVVYEHINSRRLNTGRRRVPFHLAAYSGDRNRSGLRNVPDCRVPDQHAYFPVRRFSRERFRAISRIDVDNCALRGHSTATLQFVDNVFRSLSLNRPPFVRKTRK